MSAEVVQLRRAPERAPEIVRQCACGNQWFFLHADGSIECSDVNCKQWLPGHWVEPEGAA